MAVLNPQQLTGQDGDHLVTLPCGNRLQQEVALAFAALQADARAAGFELAIASSYRSFARQLAIWNQTPKWCAPGSAAPHGWIRANHHVWSP